MGPESADDLQKNANICSKLRFVKTCLRMLTARLAESVENGKVAARRAIGD